MSSPLHSLVDLQSLPVICPFPPKLCIGYVYRLHLIYPYYLSWILKENLNTTEIKKIKFIKQSQIEINFLNVLKFYFGNSVLGSFELNGKIFDYKLGKKILIELDGGYWHSKEDVIKNDLIKNNIAKECGFILIRVSDKEVKNLEFINKLKKIYDEIK
jgi:very-short-patch-repair endonuclease